MNAAIISDSERVSFIFSFGFSFDFTKTDITFLSFLLAWQMPL